MSNVEKSNSVVPRNIVKIIDANGYKQNAIAKRAGYERQVFNAMLNGRRIIRISDLVAIAGALGVMPGDLLVTDETEKPPS